MKNFEIEKKYLVKYMPDIANCEKAYIRQGYISVNPVLRVRQKNDKYIFTFKGEGDIKRQELETYITKEQFENLWNKIEGVAIVKTRYKVPLGDELFAELDIYEESLEGFKNVEVEFDSLDKANSFIPPDWFGEDITKNVKYTNAYLSKVSNKNNKNI